MRVLPVGAAGALVLAGLVMHSASAAPSPDGVIAEVYGGGGNIGATYTSDFVELANAGTSTLDLSGYSVQYLRGTPTPTSSWRATALSGTLAGGGRYLVQEWSNTGGAVSLSDPDAVGTINLSATDGTVALVSGTAPLTCLTAADCAADPRVKDLVGYGSAVVHEGAGPAATADNTTSVARGDSLADTDDNAADFTAGAPTPQNSLSAGGGTAGTVSGTSSGTSSGTDDGGGTVGVTSGTTDGGSADGGGIDGGSADGGGIDGGSADGGSADGGGIVGGADDGGTVGVTAGTTDGGVTGGGTAGTVSGTSSGTDDGGGTVGVTSGTTDGGSADGGGIDGGSADGGGIDGGSADGGSADGGGIVGGADDGGTVGVTAGTTDGGVTGGGTAGTVSGTTGG
ncbi:hypothetical protein RVR_9511 [Actinacidiphila reveromycinica]|uniref:LTD domain-containing protein n=2 Tax=Actinacidiphila reveromycinica TaxID=659352 RepID=A0A7U3V067_9ACTN|nr:hypothetical protein RVR_9511 [Streptomyces sp. SN-593]